jgi:Zinc carboxypeptidase
LGKAPLPALVPGYDTHKVSVSVLASLVTAVFAADPIRHDADAVVTAWVDDDAELAALRAIAVELWSERPGPGAVDARVASARLAELGEAGIPFVVRIADVQQRVDDERARLVAAPAPQAATFFDDFRDYDAVVAQLDAMVAAAPELVQRVELGGSLEGRAIPALRIGTAGDDAPAVLYSGTMHAREWLATMVAMCVADDLVGGYGGDPSITDLLDRITVFVVPVLNPDGYVYSWEYDRYWRKNTRDGYGVDLNRNFDYQWAVVGASGDPNAEDYYGEAPFSEPESAAVRDFVVARPEIAAHIDFHSFSQLVLRPWGYSYDIPEDEPTLAMLGTRMSDAMWDATATDYPSIHAAELYPAAGAVDDWGYGARGIMAFTIELRGDDFVVPPSQIAPACAESVAAARELAAWVAEDAPPASSDEGGADESTGDQGHDPSGHETTGEPGESSDGSGTLDDGDADGDGTDGPAPAGDEAVLPPGFGLGGEPPGCACAQPQRGAPWLALAMLPLLRRRRRAQGT